MGELDVLGHDVHTLGMVGSKVSDLEETKEVGLGGFLEGMEKEEKMMKTEQAKKAGGAS